MLADFILTYVEVAQYSRAFVMRTENLSPTDTLAFFAFQRHYRKWCRDRDTN